MPDEPTFTVTGSGLEPPGRTKLDHWFSPASCALGVVATIVAAYLFLAPRFERLEANDAKHEVTATAQAAKEAADFSGATQRIDAIKSEYDLVHKEVTDARIVQAQHAPTAK